MKTPIKIIIVITVVLVIFGIFLFSGDDNSVRFADYGDVPFVLEVGTKGEVIQIKPYYSETDNIWYYFLPSYVKDKTLKYDEPFDLDCNGQKYKSVIKQSANLTTLFIDTESGSLDYLGESKANFEPGKLSAIDKDGNVEYCGDLTRISGRGNGSWRDEKKKPYSLVLKKEASIAGVDYGKSYNLHAMCYEGDKLHSKLIYDYADYLGEEFSTSCNWVDVYFNGEYYGLYLLREANKVEKGRIEAEKDGFLIERDREGSWDANEEDYFLSNRGVPFVFRFPEQPTSKEKESVILRANEVEEAIVKQQPIDDLVDVHSFVIQYLCDEISKNFDAFKTSGYFYQKTKNDKMCAGPVWDYDGSFGEFLEEGEIYSDPEGTILGAREGQMEWFAAIIYNENYNIDKVSSFANSLSWFREKLETGLDEQANMIRKSEELDEIRWRDDKESLSNRFAPGLYDSYDNEVKYLKWYLAKRLNYLSDEWGIDVEKMPLPDDSKESHIVTFDAENMQETITLNDGELLGDSIPEGLWVIKGTWNPVNRFIPVFEDMTMTLWEKEE